jgi:acetolactate synthase I/II/III large subunit
MQLPTRRDVLKGVAAGAVAAALPGEAEARVRDGWVKGPMTGARALVQTLIVEGTSCVFGIPGAQENELWDEMKGQGLPYLLVTHEFSASVMADGAARATGHPGVLSVVPGPGLTNALSGIGEALLDSVPLVCIVGDVARGDRYKAFQVHELPQVGLLKQVTKDVFEVSHQAQIPDAVREAFRLAVAGEPGPVGVVVPYNLLIEAYKYNSPPLAPLPVPFDDAAFHCALALLSDRKLRVGIYAGMGCMDFAPDLTRLAEVLQAPVATSVSGKGAIDECHPLAVGWGYGPQGTRTAELAFKNVDLVLAIGVRYSEVSTAFYAIPTHRHLIHVDANAHNLGRVVKPSVCVHADAGVFLARLLEHTPDICRNRDDAKSYARCGVDPVPFLLALRAATCPDALVFVDVTMSEHWAAEAFTVRKPRTYFNPTDNQAMGWSIPAALGAQRVMPGRQVVTVTGDGCLLMSAMEISTAAREGLPVKFFVLDDQAYHYMQALQQAAYKRTTATHLAHLDYVALAKAFGVEYHEITGGDIEAGIRGALAQPGPVLTRVAIDYDKRPLRWLEAARGRFTRELSNEQRVRFLARLGARSLDLHPNND